MVRSYNNSPFNLIVKQKRHSGMTLGVFLCRSTGFDRRTVKNVVLLSHNNNLLWEENMRLYSMYFLCKMNYEYIVNMEVGERDRSDITIYSINNWKDKVAVLNKLANIECLKEATIGVYESIPIFTRGQNYIEFDSITARNFIEAKEKLLAGMETIISLYETVKKVDKEKGNGFDIKLPEFKDIKDFSNCIKDIEYIVNQCPYLARQDGEIKFDTVDIGSTWITFCIIGVASTTILSNLSKIVEKAIKIKSNMVAIKQQEEVLRSMQQANSISNEAIETFQKVNKTLTDNCVRELEGEIGELQDGEEFDKVGRTIERLADWMNKGMQIYSTIDAPKEVKTLFPEQEEQILLNDDVIKFIEQINESGEE